MPTNTPKNPYHMDITVYWACTSVNIMQGVGCLVVKKNTKEKGQHWKKVRPGMSLTAQQLLAETTRYVTP